MQAIRPIEMRPAGPIQLFSKANLRKYETPMSIAAMPMRFNQWEPMRDSRSRCDFRVEAMEDLGGIRGYGAVGGGLGETGGGTVEGSGCAWNLPGGAGASSGG